MKIIPLTQGKVAMVDDEDYERIAKYKWYALKNNSTYYAVHTTGDGKEQKTISMAREIMRTPKNLMPDHINHNGLDNRKDNMRNCNRTQNAHNSQKRKRCSSKYKGVHWASQIKRWRAIIHYKKRKISLGCFSKEIEAALVYDEKARELFGEFANTNCKT